MITIINYKQARAKLNFLFDRSIMVDGVEVKIPFGEGRSDRYNLTLLEKEFGMTVAEIEKCVQEFENQESK